MKDGSVYCATERWYPELAYMSDPVKAVWEGEGGRVDGRESTSVNGGGWCGRFRTDPCALLAYRRYPVPTLCVRL